MLIKINIFLRALSIVSDEIDTVFIDEAVINSIHLLGSKMITRHRKYSIENGTAMA